MNRSRFQAGFHLCLIAVAAVLIYSGAAAAGELSVCIDESSPVAAMEQQLASAVARQDAQSPLHRLVIVDDDNGRYFEPGPDRSSMPGAQRSF